MKQRTCDKCHNIISPGVLYFKVCSQHYVGKQLKSEHVGDLCTECWKIDIPDGKMEEVDIGTDSLL